VRLYKNLIVHNNGYYIFDDQHNLVVWLYREINGYGEMLPEVHTAWWCRSEWEHFNEKVIGKREASWLELLLVYGVSKQEAQEKVYEVYFQNRI
jgi:hypothetical protein